MKHVMKIESKMQALSPLRVQSLIDSKSDSRSAARIVLQSELQVAPTISDSEGEPLRHILLGSPGGVRQTIHLLHMLRYVENALWSPLVTIPNDQLIITPRQGEVMSLLIRHLHPQG